MLLAAVATLAGAAVQSATGFGFALVASPALFAVFDPHEAVLAVAVLGSALSLLVLSDGGPIHWRGLVPMLLAAIPGLALGLLVLEAVSKSALQVGVGLAVIAAALFQLTRTSRRPPQGARVEKRDDMSRNSTRTLSRSSTRAPSGLGGVLTGLASGTLTTSISVNGPPLVLWLEARGARPDELRASMAASFLALNLLGGVALVVSRGPGDVVEPGRLLPLLALVVAGHAAGAIAFRRLDGRTFRLAVLGLVLVAGAASAIAGLAGL